jgi:Helix-turn-helix domain
MEIRDARNKEWFWLDNEYLNGYAKYLGATCTVVYISLCRHSDNKTQTCFPSMETMAIENGINPKSVSRSIKKLKDWNIIAVQENYDKKNKKRKNNIYTLLAKNEWKPKPQDIKSTGESHQTYSPKPQDNLDESHQTPVPSNKTHINNTQLNNTSKHSLRGADIIKSFEVVNPSCKNMYGNITQRNACDELIETYSFEEVMKVIAILPKTNKMTYFPTITTPLQLWNNYQKLKDKLIQEKNKNISKQVKVAF